MGQMRLQLRQDQTAALGQLAAERGATVSELVRQAIDLLLAREAVADSPVPSEELPQADTSGATDAMDSAEPA